jgi:hypothetical protein
VSRLYVPWFPGIIKHCGPLYCLISETPRGSSGFSNAICSGVYQAGGWRAYSKGQKKRRSYENSDGFGYLQENRTITIILKSLIQDQHGKPQTKYNNLEKTINYDISM